MNSFTKKSSRRVRAATPPSKSGLIFFHVAKTGGTSLARYLRDALPGPHFQQEDPLNQDFIDALLSAKHALYSGHFCPAQCLDRIPANWFKLTALRNPLSVIRSQYEHVKLATSLQHIHHQSELFQEEAFALQRAANTLTMTEFFSLRDDFRTFFDNPQIRFLTGYTGDRVNHRHLVEAIKVAERMDFVGIAEAPEITISVLKKALRFAAHPELMALNTTPKNRTEIGTIPYSAIEAMMRCTKYDKLLYDTFASRLSAIEEQDHASPEQRPAQLTEVRGLPLYDLFRTSELELHNVDRGTSFQILEDEILLHPPRPEDGVARATISLALNGRRQIHGVAFLDSEHSQPVTFRFLAETPSRLLANMEITVRASERVSFSLSIPPSATTCNFTIETRMAEGAAGNHYAWARIGNLQLR